MEFESFYSGTLLHIGVQEGETAAVDSVLAIIGNEGEDYKALLEGGKSDSSEEKSETKQEATASEGESVSEEPTAKAEIPAGVEIITMPQIGRASCRER